MSKMISEYIRQKVVQIQRNKKTGLIMITAFGFMVVVLILIVSRSI